MSFKKIFINIYYYTLLFFSSSLNKKNIYSRFKGVKFGDNVRILHYPRWGSEPYLIEIGHNVTITRGVSFINHDGGVALFRDEFPELNVYGRIKVGNNVFIGVNSIIMPGVTIGNNVVVGAGSIVNKDIPNNVVVAGVPAKVLKSIKEYKDSAMKKSIQLHKNKNRKEQILDFFRKKIEN